MDVVDDRQRLRDRTPREIAVQGGRRHFAGGEPSGEQRADLGREYERVAVVVIVKGLDPEAVADQRERAPPGGPESEREHPPPIRNRGAASRAEAPQQNLGGAPASKSQPA